MPRITTFRSPVLSLWQSAINEVMTRRNAAQPGVLGDSEPHLSADTPIMMQSVAVAQALLSGQPIPEAAVLGGEIGDCAKLYLQLILARATRNSRKVAKLKNEISFSTCDPLWADTLLQYQKFRRQRRQIPYRPYQHLDDYVRPLPSQGEVKIALIADWGTGMPVARQLLAEVGQQKPDVLIHLGDIYYSGTSNEVQANFLAVCQSMPGLNIPIYTLSGNHDMYSGGGGYYWLLDQIGQPASYFCLRNDSWQLLGLDTGLHDNDPGTVISNLTYLDEQEAAWQRDKIASAGRRRTVLLSHHQLFSAAAGGVGATSDGKPLAVNPRLYDSFKDLLGQIDLWMWGHEHNLIVFDEYVGLKRGRCIGSAAIPTLVDQNPYATDPNLVLPPGASGPPPIHPGVRLGDNGEFYNHAYALLTLRGRAATLTYYEMPSDDGGSVVLFEEQL